MKALLIHNDNLPSSLIGRFQNTLLFNIGQAKMLERNFSFDREAHIQLEKSLKEKEFDVIFIPYTLSNINYLELSGLRLALHIRLTPEWEHARTPIVFIGHETPAQIAKLSDLGSFLFTTGIFTTQKFEYKELQKQYEWITKEWRERQSVLNDSEYAQFLSRIIIKPPANYVSHHSVDNELALLRWSEYLKCDNEISEVKENLQTGLFFKHQKALNPIEPVGDGKQFSIQKKAKILLIDDEGEKGWYKFYEAFFRYSPNIKLESLNIDKSLSRERIFEKAKEKIKEYDPDVVLLDLRLCDKDFEKNVKPEDLTGYKILQEIKKNINKGIQVIITTASNKAWNYEPLMRAGANGYIIKNGFSDIPKDILNLKRVIEKGIERAGYLKEAFKSIVSMSKEIEELIKKKNLDKKFGNELIKHLNLSFTMYDSSQEEEEFAYSYIALFKCLELINEHYVFQDKDEWYLIGPIKLYQYKWNNISATYTVETNPSFKNNIPTTFEKIAGLCFQLLSCNNEDNIEDVKGLYHSIKRRNEFIHPSGKLKDEVKKIYTPEGFKILIGQISKIIKKIIELRKS